MANRYVDVSISRQTQAVAQAGFGVPLILATEKDFALKEYTDLATVGVDYGTGSNTYKVATAILAQNPKVASFKIVGVLFTEGTTAVTVLSAKLDATRLLDDDWYYLVSPAHADATIVALSTWAEANKKFYFTSTANKALAATINRERSVILVHPTPLQFPAEAWVGVGAPKEIGSYTWTFKTLSGIDPSGYNTTDINTIEAGNASTYIKEGGVNITSKGVTTSGEYIDIIQGQDYITAKLTENVFRLLAASDKVPYTPQGVALIIAEIERTLKDANRAGVIADDAEGKPLFQVTAPEFNDISANDKASRMLPNIVWTATVAGAVENVDINGILTL